MTMKKLGLIGGIGPESTIPYYRGIVYGVQEQLGKPFFPNLAIESLNVFEVLDMSRRGELAALAEYLLCGINNLAAGGADFAALTGNTPHIVFDVLQERSPIPLVSIVETCRDEARRRGFCKVGLLGTPVTMDGAFFSKPFESCQIELVKPTEEEKAYIGLKISEELELGIVRQETVSAFLAIVHRMMDKEKIQAIVLGCTELPLLFKDTTLPVDVLDTMRIHIKTLVDLLLDKSTQQNSALSLRGQSSPCRKS